jgi:ferrochelatase
MKKRAVLLVNLGSPDSPSVSDVRAYLREFLMDGRVLDAPWPVRWAIVNLTILPGRPAQSAEAYHKIWTAEGSPLIVTSRKVQAALERRLGLPVELAMRYRNPSIESAIGRLREKGCEELLVIPLFPHYAMSSYETAARRVIEVARGIAPGMSLAVLPPYYEQPEYIGALAASAAKYLEEDFQHLLFSFHGLPERHLRKADPTGCHCLRVKDCCQTPSPAHGTCYRAQCFKTVAAFVKHTGLPEHRYSVAFQSRLGRDPWLKPYTDAVLEGLGKAGVRKLLVICPAFVADCLETIEEIGLRGRETFLRAGGGELTLIPCLNDHPAWIAALEKMAGNWIGNTATGAGSSALPTAQARFSIKS